MTLLGQGMSEDARRRDIEESDREYIEQQKSKHIWCISTNTAGTNSLTVVAGRLGRVYMTQEEKETWEKDPRKKGIAYLVQPGTIQQQERDRLEQQQKSKQPMSEIKYKIVNGTSYHEETRDEVITVLERCRLNEVRIILDYGDVETGQSWGESMDTTGTLGRSMGPTKVPILLYNARSMGGGAILDHCIIRIQEAKGKRILYQHPKYKPYNESKN